MFSGGNCDLRIHKYKYTLQFGENNFQVSHIPLKKYNLIFPFTKSSKENTYKIDFNRYFNNEIFSPWTGQDDFVLACEDAVLSYRLYLTYLASCLLNLAGVWSGHMLHYSTVQSHGTPLVHCTHTCTAEPDSLPPWRFLFSQTQSLWTNALHPRRPRLCKAK